MPIPGILDNSTSALPYWFLQMVRGDKARNGSDKTVPKQSSGQMGGGVFSHEVDSTPSETPKNSQNPDNTPTNKMFDWGTFAPAMINTAASLFQTYADQKADRKKAEAASRAADAQHAYDVMKFEQEMALRKQEEARLNAQMYIEAQLKKGATLQDAYQMYVNALQNAAQEARLSFGGIGSGVSNAISSATEAMAKMGPRK